MIVDVVFLTCIYLFFMQVLEGFPEHHHASLTSGKINLKQRKINSDADDDSSDTTAEEQLPQEGVYPCPDPSCQKQYVKSWGLEKHLAVGIHQYRQDETGVDAGIKSDRDVFLSSAEIFPDCAFPKS